MKNKFIFCCFLFAGQLSAQVITRIDPRTISSPDKSEKTWIKSGGVDYEDNKNSTSSASGRLLTASETAAFYELDIPSVIASTPALTKAAFKNLSIGIDDDVLSFSTGIKKKTVKDPARFGLTVKAKAPDGTKPVLSGGKFSSQFSAGIRYTFGDNTNKWFLVDKTSQVITTDLSSVHNTWWNVYVNIGVSNLKLIVNDSTSASQNPLSGEILVSYNTAFHSLYIPRYIHRRNIFSIGAGIGRFNNYTSLDEQTLREGIAGAGGNRFLETKSTTGRIGDFRNTVGAVLRSALYVPLTKPFSYHAVYLGMNLNSFGIFTDKHVLNGQSGLYWSKRKVEDSDDKTAKVLKEEFSIGLILNMKGLDKLKQKSFFTEIAELGISAQIPLGF